MLQVQNSSEPDPLLATLEKYVGITAMLCVYVHVFAFELVLGRTQIKLKFWSMVEFFTALTE